MEGTMNDQTFVGELAIKAGLTNQETEVFIRTLALTIADQLKEKSAVEIDGIGIFKMADGKIVFEQAKDLI